MKYWAVFLAVAAGGAPPTQASEITAFWVNDGGDKVTQDELRQSQNGAHTVTNSLWDGKRVKLFGARNEVLGFNLVLEAAKTSAKGVSIQFNRFIGPGGFRIETKETTNKNVFQWVNRDIEIFLVRYLKIKGLSLLSYGSYDERHIPRRLQRPSRMLGIFRGGWENRPDHDKHYPETAVPLELTAGVFDVAAGQNQSIWVDIYIPKQAPPGAYLGDLVIKQQGHAVNHVLLDLEVKKFTLPDVPTSKTMVFLGYDDVARRYLGFKSGMLSPAADHALRAVRDRHFQVAHRHRISLIDADPAAAPALFGQPRAQWIPRLDGTLFTEKYGYSGPGVGTGNGVYSIGTYGSWPWKTSGKDAMIKNADAWERWFAAHAPQTEHFLYLDDESTDYKKIEEWASWVKQSTGPGRDLKTLVTMPLPTAMKEAPSLGAVAFWFTTGITKIWHDAFEKAKRAQPQKLVMAYNGMRPSNGSFATEDDGVALRELPWAQYKMGIHRWFFWESTYYNNYQGGVGETNVFEHAQTFGGKPNFDKVLGMTSWNHSNGDGVLFYPGTDKVFPKESYGVPGPLVSLRLKHWRRGIQDVDYINLAREVDVVATQRIVQRMVPKALWEYGVAKERDPSYVRADISWSINPDDWEAARRQLADIIERKH